MLGIETEYPEENGDFKMTSVCRLVNPLLVVRRVPTICTLIIKDCTCAEKDSGIKRVSPSLDAFYIGVETSADKSVVEVARV